MPPPRPAGNAPGPGWAQAQVRGPGLMGGERDDEDGAVGRAHAQDHRVPPGGVGPVEVAVALGRGEEAFDQGPGGVADGPPDQGAHRPQRLLLAIEGDDRDRAQGEANEAHEGEAPWAPSARTAWMGSRNHQRTNRSSG